MIDLDMRTKAGFTFNEKTFVILLATSPTTAKKIYTKGTTYASIINPKITFFIMIVSSFFHGFLTVLLKIVICNDNHFKNIPNY